MLVFGTNVGYGTAKHFSRKEISFTHQLVVVFAEAKLRIQSGLYCQ